jgi:hypothetical protein
MLVEGDIDGFADKLEFALNILVNNMQH